MPIDCTLTIENSDMWHEYPRSIVYGGINKPTRVDRPIGNRKRGDEQENGFFATELEMTTESFTHIDAPYHRFSDGKAIDELGVEEFMGDAAVFDMSHKEPGGAVTANDLQAADVDLREGDIAIIRTDWTDEAWGTERFWTEMIHLADDAGAWLMDQNISGLAQDFYTDARPVEVCDDCHGLVGRKHYPNHDRFLSEGLVLFEWCTNFGAIGAERVEFVGLPIKINEGGSAPARVVVRE